MTEEMDGRFEEAEQVALPGLDLNLATPDELQGVPGIGPVLAQRIVEYRETRGGFLSKDELLGVSGVGAVLLDRIAPYFAVESPERDLRPEEMEDLAEFFPADAMPVVEEIQGVEGEAAQLQEGTKPEADAVTSPSWPEPEPPVQAPMPAPAPSGSRWSWFWAAVLGGLLGLIGALFVLVAINGALDLRQTPAILEMSGRIGGLSGDVANLQADVATVQVELDAAQQQLKSLQELPGRVDAVEKTATELGNRVRDLAERTNALSGRVDGVEKDVGALQKRVDNVDGFFRELQSLLAKAFGPAPSTAN
jgi:competence ComEA-like helix-hairpin-helix protein